MKKPRHPKYKIKAIDTLQKITNTFQLEESTWKRYHNNMCSLDDIIRDSLPTHLTEIYLFPELWHKELDLNFPPPEEEIYPKPNYGFDNTLYLKNIIQKIQYGVEIAIQKTQKVETKLRYKILLNWKAKQDDYQYVEIEAPTETYINDLSPEFKADRLAIKTYNALFPLMCKINNQGYIVEIINFADLQKRWQRAIKEISKEWTGEKFEKYMRLNSNTMTSEETFRNKLHRNVFISSLFNGIYQSYTSSYTINRQLVVPLTVESENKIVFETQSVIAQREDKYGLIFLNIKGKSTNIDNSTYKAKYFVDSKSRYIHNMMAIIDTPKKNITIKITKI